MEVVHFAPLQLIKESKAYTEMRAAESAANANPHLLALSAQYEQIRNELQEKTMEEEPEYEAIGELSRQMDSLQDRMMRDNEMKTLQKKREAFTNLMNMVNRELQGIIAPETLLNECSGSCSSCSSGCGGA